MVKRESVARLAMPGNHARRLVWMALEPAKVWRVPGLLLPALLRVLAPNAAAPLTTEATGIMWHASAAGLSLPAVALASLCEDRLLFNLLDLCTRSAFHLPTRGSRNALLVGSIALLSACGSVHVPFTKSTPPPPDLSPSRASADNMVRLDAAMRSGCAEVSNIDKPQAAATPSAASDAPQRWVAHTCTGDISYDVVTTPGPDGPILKVLPVAGPLNNPMNPHFVPVMPGN